MAKRSKRGAFVYDKERRLAGVKQHSLAQQVADEFDDAIKRAYGKRDPDPLGSWLRSNYHALTEEQGDALAVLIERVLRNRRGTPPGSQPTRRLEGLIIHLARKERERQRRSLNLKPGEPLPKGSIKQIIEDVMSSERFDGEFSKMDDTQLDRMTHNVRKALLRGVKT